MIEIKLHKTFLRLDFSFFAVLALFLLTDDSDFGIIALSSCAAHELAHFAVMCFCGAEVCAVTFYGAGIRISSDNVESLRYSACAAIYAAGCTMNFILAAVLWLANCPEAALINVFIGAFNMLPIGELDGARLLKLAAIRLCRAEQVDNVTRVFAIISAILAASAVILFCGGVSFTLATTALYFILVGSQKI